MVRNYPVGKSSEGDPLQGKNLNHFNNALSLMAYFVLTILKILQWFKDKKLALNFSIRLLA